ncbi:MarR family winged helix-turn-helix transcriptional regulator [Priestia aryabhattai]|uniref:MarR family winged helix-turn-helix transcriptional regulator n=1 Tax=Priestia aryabhattai TaxID=412384 RepID=UPI001875FD2B|nr:MarR family transcriptional regulator [Priestia aryabhattai]MBE5103381.1 MarR family transcriptional regulator [Priestia aryabhattai]
MYQGNEKEEKDLRVFRIWLKATKTVFDNVLEDVKGYGLTPDNFMVLELLYNKGPQYIQTISEKLMIPSGSITYVVNKLEKKELVRKEQESNNRRYWKVTITEKGEALFNEIFPQHAETIGKQLSSLNENQKEQLAELLKIVGLTAKELREKG